MAAEQRGPPPFLLYRDAVGTQHLRELQSG